eukprot:3850244-Amphidinium_carterae.1
MNLALHKKFDSYSPNQLKRGQQQEFCGGVTCLVLLSMVQAKNACSCWERDHRKTKVLIAGAWRKAWGGRIYSPSKNDYITKALKIPRNSSPDAHRFGDIVPGTVRKKIRASVASPLAQGQRYCREIQTKPLHEEAISYGSKEEPYHSHRHL